MIRNSARLTVILLISSLLFSCVVKSPRQGPGSSPLLKIQDIRVAEGTDKTIVEIEGEGLMLFTSFQLTDPDRLILEISEVDLGKYRNEIVLSEGPIHSIIPIPMDNIFVSRLEFELADHVKADVRPEGLNIVVEVTQSGEGMDRMGQAQHAEEMPAASTALAESMPKDKQASEMENAGPEGKVGGPAVGALPLPPPVMPPVAVGGEQGAGPMVPSSKDAMAGLESEVAKPATSIKVPPDASSSSIVPPLGMVKKVTAVRVIEGDQPQVLVKMNGESPAKVFYSDAKKTRLILDFPGLKASDAKASVPGDGRLVERIRTGRHPDKIRMVLDLLKPVEYSWEQSRGELKILLKPRDP